MSSPLLTEAENRVREILSSSHYSLHNNMPPFYLITLRSCFHLLGWFWESLSRKCISAAYENADSEPFMSTGWSSTFCIFKSCQVRPFWSSNHSLESKQIMPNMCMCVCAHMCAHVRVHGHAGARAHPVSIYYDLCMVCYDFKSTCS